MTYYLDTSALVKIYPRESGTEEVLRIYAGDDHIQSS